MADFQALAGVSLTLQALLLDRMEWPVNVTPVPPPVTMGPPPYLGQDIEPHRQTIEKARLNLFLYRVTENGYLQNQEIPGRGSPSAYGHPPLSLNLHYLLTPYGNKEEGDKSGVFDDSIAQSLLGSAMRALHDTPIITQNMLTQRPVSGRQILHDSLRYDFEHVKLTLEPLSLEDVTKVWTALGLRYRLSAAYVINVVQIESRRARSFPKPVGQPLSPTNPPLPTDPPSPGPMVYALTIQTPTITDVFVRRANTNAEQPFPYANVGDTLILRGSALAGPLTTVAIGDVIVTASVAKNDRVEAAIPDDSSLQPGAQTVRVTVSDPLIPQSAFSSNDAAFMLVPFVDPTNIAYTQVSTGANGQPRYLTIKNGSRLIGPDPGGETVIGRTAVERADYLDSVAVSSPTQILVPIRDSLPEQRVCAIIGSALPSDRVTPGGQQLKITIDGVQKAIAANFPIPIPSFGVDDLVPLVAGLIHDAGAAQNPPGQQPTPALPGFVGAQVGVWRDHAGPRFVIVPGRLRLSIQIDTTDPFAKDLGFDANITNVANGWLSGELPSPPPLSSPVPQLKATIGGQSATIKLSKPASLAALAADLQAQFAAAGGPFTGTLVATVGSQLLIAPPAGAIDFAAADGDSTTVGELQLKTDFAVRVRVNGAESVDKPPTPATVRLPQ